MKVAEIGEVGYRPGVVMEVTRNPQRIEQETVHFMDALLNGRQDENLQDKGVSFQPDFSDLDYFLSPLSQLSQNSQGSLVLPLTQEEVKDVLKSCINGKSPGLDGLTYELKKNLACNWRYLHHSSPEPTGQNKNNGIQLTWNNTPYPKG